MRFISEFIISEYDAEILTREKEAANYFEEAVGIGKDHNINPKSLANYIINKKINLENTLPAEFIKAIISTSTYAIIDNRKIKKVVSGVLAQNPQATSDYKTGKTQALQFLIGKTMSVLKEKIDTKIVIEEINNQIK